MHVYLCWNNYSNNGSLKSKKTEDNIMNREKERKRLIVVGYSSEYENKYKMIVSQNKKR